MEISDIFNTPKYVSYKTALQNPEEQKKESSESYTKFKELLNTPLFPTETQERAKKVADKVQEEEEQKEDKESKSNNYKFIGDSIELAGFKVPKSWVENVWRQECGTSLGQIDTKHKKGVVVTSNSGKADNPGGKKTYGPGLLYNPETGKLMQDSEPSNGYSTEELTRLFYVGLEKALEKAKSVGCKTWNQAIAYAGMVQNFGPNHSKIKKLTELIQSNVSEDTIFDFIAHASDGQKSQFPGLIKRRMWEARQWVGDFDSGGYDSKQNVAKVNEFNKPKKARFGGFLDLYAYYNLTNSGYGRR